LLKLFLPSVNVCVRVIQYKARFAVSLRGVVKPFEICQLVPSVRMFSRNNPCRNQKDLQISMRSFTRVKFCRYISSIRERISSRSPYIIISPLAWTSLEVHVTSHIAIQSAFKKRRCTTTDPGVHISTTYIFFGGRSLYLKNILTPASIFLTHLPLKTTTKLEMEPALNRSGM